MTTQGLLLKLDDALAAKLKALWADHSLAIPDLSNRLGLHETTIRRYAASLGLGKRKLTSSVWSDEQTELLRRLWDTGLSGGQIAKLLGHGVSRNAVIGKANRMGLEGRQKPSPPKRVPARPRPAPRVERVVVAGNGATILVPEPDRAPWRVVGDAAFLPLPNSAPRNWTERPRNGCRWPVGGDGADLLSCCAQVTRGFYCEPHAQIAYVPLKPSQSPKEMSRSLRRYA